MKKIEWKKIFSSMKNKWGVLLFGSLIFIISLINIRNEGYLLSNDNYSPELNPMMTVERSIISPAWRSYRGLGVASDSEQSDVFRSLFFWFSNFVIDESNLRVFYYLFMLALGGLFAGLLSKEIFEFTDNKKNSQVVFILSSILYISSLWTVWLFYQNITPYINNWGVFPLILFLTLKYIQNPNLKSATYLFLGSVLFVSTALVSTLLWIDLIFYVGFILFFSLIVKRKLDRKSIWVGIKSLLIFLSVNLFWILPFFFYSSATSGDVVSSRVNRTITSSIIDLERGTQTGVNSLRFYSRIISKDNEEWMRFQLSEIYLENDLYKLLGLIPAVFSAVFSFFILVKKKFFYLILLGIFFVSWFLIKVDNPPWGEVFTWLQNNIPLFKQVFRWPTSKLSGIFLIAMSICSSIGVAYFIDLLQYFGKTKLSKRVILGIVVLLFGFGQLLFGGYLFSGNLFPENAFVYIPDEYFSLGEYLKENDPSGRIYYAPPSNNNYFREYDWGFNGSQFISYVIPNPVMDLSLTVGSGIGEEAMVQLSNSFRAADKESFFNYLKQYDISYLLLDKSVVTDGFSFDVDLNKSEVVWKDFEKIWSEGSISLYEVPSTQYPNATFEEVIGNNIPGKTFTKDNALYPSFYPYLVDLRNIEISGDKIIGEFVYNGESMEYESNISDLNWRVFQTGLKKEFDEISIFPEYPRIINDVENGIKRNYRLVHDYEYYVIDDSVVRKSDIEDGVVIDKPFLSTISLLGIEEGDFERNNITQDILLGIGQDCSGDESGDVNVRTKNKEGFYLDGDVILPCVYSEVGLEIQNEWVGKIRISWKGNLDAYPGFCLYSKNQDKCLNNMRYMNSSEGDAEIEYVIPSVISKDDTVTLILYSLVTKGELIFKEVNLDYATGFDEIDLFSVTNEVKEESLILDNRGTYSVSLPIARGSKSYVYTPERYPGMIWQPTTQSDGDYSIFLTGGMGQEVTDGFVDQSIDFFSPGINNEIYVYFNGSNLSNIPSSFCINYLGSEDCWYENMMLDGGDSYFVDLFESDILKDAKFGGIFGSYSYEDKSSNILREFSIFEVPDYWSEIMYRPSVPEVDYFELELDRDGKSIFSTRYVGNSVDSKDTNMLVTIPESKSKGWIAFGKIDGKWRTIENNRKVLVNGWKQGWDITNLNCDQITVIFWPNFLSYFGYLVIAILFLYLIIKLLADWNERE